MNKNEIITNRTASAAACRDWTLDRCPVCGEPAIMACRCMVNHRTCVNQHSWYRDKNGEAVLAGHAPDSVLGPRPGVTEHGEQSALIDWVRHNLIRLPQLHMLHAVPNGGARPATINPRGKRVSITGALLQAEGQRSGVPDLELDYPARRYHGLRIEMKKPGGKVSGAQTVWLNALKVVGYAAIVCWRFEDARDALEWYLDGDIPPEGIVWPEWSFTWEYGVPQE